MRRLAPMLRLRSVTSHTAGDKAKAANGIHAGSRNHLEANAHGPRGSAAVPCENRMCDQNEWQLETPIVRWSDQRAASSATSRTETGSPLSSRRWMTVKVPHRRWNVYCLTVARPSAKVVALDIH